MIVPTGVKVYLAPGITDMRKGIVGLANLVQESLKKNLFSGHLFAFRAMGGTKFYESVEVTCPHEPVIHDESSAAW